MNDKVFTFNIKEELIDTCWNVNDITIVVFDEAISELIDTCWNVNAFRMCLGLILLMELIDTCWNVNYHQAAPGHHQAAELIDTCWNVNLTGRPATSPRLAGINRYMLECKFNW